MPSPAIWKVLSCEPYSSAACAIRPTLGTLPMVAGSNAPLRLAVVDHHLVDAGVAAVRDHRLGVLQLAVRVPHAAASRGSSPASRRRRSRRCGTCRLVMPLSELTIASARALRVQRGDVGLDRAALGLRQLRQAWRTGRRCRCSGRSRAAASARGVLLQHRRGRSARTAMPNMIGSETFIIVAFRCSENSTPWPWHRRSARR